MKIPDSFFHWSGEIDPQERKIQPFSKTKDPFGWFGNMSDHPVIFNNMRFHTTEHLFQCMRLKDPSHISMVRGEKSPMSCKMKMKSLVKSDPDCFKWSPRSLEDLEWMFDVVKLKIDQHPFIRKELERMDPESVIIEDSSKRNGESSVFWGMKFDGKIWKGENFLGRIWMSFLEKKRNPGGISSPGVQSDPQI